MGNVGTDGAGDIATPQLESVIGVVGGNRAVALNEQPPVDRKGSGRPQVPFRRVFRTGIAEKLGIDVEQLIDAVNEAVSEIRDEARLRWMDKVVEEGWLTAEEAQEYSDWWAAKPDIEFDFGDCGPLERHAFGGFRIHGGCGFGVWHVPDCE